MWQREDKKTGCSWGSAYLTSPAEGAVLGSHKRDVDAVCWLLQELPHGDGLIAAIHLCYAVQVKVPRQLPAVPNHNQQMDLRGLLQLPARLLTVRPNRLWILSFAEEGGNKIGW